MSNRPPKQRKPQQQGGQPVQQPNAQPQLGQAMQGQATQCQTSTSTHSSRVSIPAPQQMVVAPPQQQMMQVPPQQQMVLSSSPQQMMQLPPQQLGPPQQGHMVPGYINQAPMQQYIPSQLPQAQLAQSTITTTTTTYNTAGQPQQAVQQPMAQLTGQMQNIHIQQRPPLQALPPLVQRSLPPPVQQPMMQTYTTQQVTQTTQSKAEAARAARQAQRTEQEQKKAREEELRNQERQQQLQIQQQRDQERQQRQQERQQRQEERQQQELMQDQMRQQNMLRQNRQGYGGMETGMGGAPGSSTTITTTQTTQMLSQMGAGTGQHRRQALAEGQASVERLNQRIQLMLSQFGICPMGFTWLPVSDGYLCNGGNHFIADTDIDLLLDGQTTRPKIHMVNSYSNLMRFPPACFIHPSEARGIEPHEPAAKIPLKKPPDSILRLSSAWCAYESAKVINRRVSKFGKEYVLMQHGFDEEGNELSMFAGRDFGGGGMGGWGTGGILGGLGLSGWGFGGGGL